MVISGYCVLAWVPGTGCLQFAPGDPEATPEPLELTPGVGAPPHLFPLPPLVFYFIS